MLYTFYWTKKEQLAISRWRDERKTMEIVLTICVISRERKINKIQEEI
jgi:hypothetical protein